MTEFLQIESFSDEGLGLVKGIHVPFVLPGEEVTISRPFKKKGKKIAEALEVQKYSSHRVTPFCPHFGSCGGCLTEHFDYQGEALWEGSGYKVLFAHFQKDFFYPIIRAPRMQGWHNRMEFTFSHKGELGLHRFFGKRRVFDVEHCSLGPPWFQRSCHSFSRISKRAGAYLF